MNTVLTAVCCLLLFYIKGGSGAWKNDRHCGESRYPDAGELTPPFGRIVGGDVARKNEFPYQVAIWHFGGWVTCGGVLITKYWMLTAAHCVVSGGVQFDVNTFNAKFEIRLGEHDTTQSTSKEKTRQAAQVIVHEQYNEVSLINDIALIQLDKKAGNADGRIRSICRPTAGKTYDDETVVASGWGQLSVHGGRTDVLRYAPLIVMSHASCSNVESVETNMVCATDGFADEDRGVCFGDSGGPLAWKNNGLFHLVGLSSWGRPPCAAGGLPGVFTRVSDFLDWIDAKI